MTDQLILRQLKMMPDNLKQEVADFIGYLLQKHQRQEAAKIGEVISLSDNLDTILMEDAELLKKLAQ